MPRFRVSLISRGMGALLTSRGMADAMKGRAEKVAAQARSTAPVVSGEYRDSIHAESHVGPTRASGRCIASVHYAASVEARHRTLGRAINAAGGA